MFVKIVGQENTMLWNSTINSVVEWVIHTLHIQVWV